MFRMLVPCWSVLCSECSSRAGVHRVQNVRPVLEYACLVTQVIAGQTIEKEEASSNCLSKTR